MSTDSIPGTRCNAARISLSETGAPNSRAAKPTPFAALGPASRTFFGSIPPHPQCARQLKNGRPIRRDAHGDKGITREVKRVVQALHEFRRQHRFLALGRNQCDRQQHAANPAVPGSTWPAPWRRQDRPREVLIVWSETTRSNVRTSRRILPGVIGLFRIIGAESRQPV